MSPSNTARKKICIVTSSLGKGGAEKSSAVLSALLHNLGYEVHIISVLNTIDYDYKGTLLNLGALKDKDASFFGKIKRFWSFFNYLRVQKFDFIIDSRSRPSILKQFLINKVLYANEKVIFIIHSAFLKNYIPDSKIIASYLYSNAIKFVTVSKSIKSKLTDKYHFENVSVIYNALDESQTTALSESFLLPENFMIFFGRIEDEVKNLSLLIDGYKRSDLIDNNINLVILGDGADELKLEQKVQAMSLTEHVKFLPYTKNPYPIVREAMCTVLTSRYEGFSIMLAESLSLGTPVISVNCESGPSEIILDTHNGLLIENNNPDLLAEAMNLFVTDTELYNRCKNNAKKSVEKFSMDTISKDWKRIIEENT
ncbi:glycosyltransferase [Flavobacteriaceae bacterium]|nr:glycosyltransferase [Flavobacteriaceae bacterium]